MSTVDSAKAKAKEVAWAFNSITHIAPRLTVRRVEDFNKAKAVAISAGKSGAYLYPIKVSHKGSLGKVPGSRWKMLMAEGHFLLPCASWIMVRSRLILRSACKLIVIHSRKPLISKLVPTLTLSVGVVAFMFIFTYIPQGTRLRTTDRMLGTSKADIELKSLCYSS